jgi:hypothetical protein
MLQLQTIVIQSIPFQMKVNSSLLLCFVP